MVAGHETTASSLTWALYGLSLDPNFQRELRDEIKATRARAVQRGNAELTAADLDSMRLLNAVLKVLFYGFRYEIGSPLIPGFLLPGST